MTTTMITTGATASAVQTQNLFGGDLVDRFVKFAGVAAKSAATYKTAIRQLSKYFAANGITQPTREDLLNWRDSLTGKSPATVQLYVTSCKLLFRWLAQEGLYPNIADNLKSGVKLNHDHKKDALTAAQAGTLLKSVSTSYKASCKERDGRRHISPLKAKRDKAIVALMMSTGLRCIEVERANVEDVIDQFGRVYLLVQGKGHAQKDCKVLIPQQVVTLIRNYLAERGEVVGSDPLFVSTAKLNKGARLSTQSISKMIKANLRANGLDTPRLSAHSLRHTAATTMILAGVELTQVQQVLRHVNINTTMIYNNAIERMKNTAEQTAADSIFQNLSA